ncbi:phenolic glucoside malonyltransferase 1-like [Benincasa hispida]|uniref:phenolic glucoside malonyltransferase 1-like n=1 Tax=Benincasa hispida TaxID=102211 RepID=UPI0019017266|nr:phenolic glucoside malonyltransferase 1-like [Benincasa hispida]
MKIIEVCKVSPSLEESTTAPKSLPLTFFDILWIRFPPTQCLFFYKLSSTGISFVDAVLPNLKSSLALALRYYLPLAGNLVWPQHYAIPTIEFVDGDGVLLTVAEAEIDADFERLSGHGFREVEEYHPLVPKLDVSHDHAAGIALQVTVFGNKGFSIGISNHHAVLDGKTSTSFLKLWARLCHLHVNGGSPIPPIDFMPFYDRSLIDDSRGLAGNFSNAWLNDEGPNNRSLKLKLPKTTPPPGLIRYTLEFSHQNLQKVRQWVMKKRQKENENSHISSFALAYAYLCVCTAKLDGLRDGKLAFGFGADARSRLKPSLPSNYFGNCLSGRACAIERKDLLSEKGILLAIQAISEAVKSLGEETLDGIEHFCPFLIASFNDDSPEKVLSISGSPKFEVYSADFGWGKPKKMEWVSVESSTEISLTDRGNGDGGIEIGLVKEKHEMERLVDLFVKGLRSDFESPDSET